MNEMYGGLSSGPLRSRFAGRLGTAARTLLIIILALTVYSNTLRSEFQFDDKDFIVNNPAITDISDINAIWNSKGLKQRFVPFLSFALNYHFHKFDVFGYHLVNVLIHIANALLVWWMVNLLLIASEGGSGEPPVRAPVLRRPSKDIDSIAFLAALIFLLHPIQTESVSYITQRFASMATLFYLASMCCYIKARTGGSPLPPSEAFEGRLGRAARTSYYFYILSAEFAVLAMLSKQIAFTLPVMIIIYEIYFPSSYGGLSSGPLRSRFGGRLRTAALTISILLAILFIPFLYNFNASGILGREFISRSHEGDYLNWITYGLTQFAVIGKYVQLILVPVGQNFDYDFPAVYSLMEPVAFTCFAAVMVLFYAALRLFDTNRLASFCLVWFFVTLSVESSIITLPHVIFEHRLYLPMVGVAILMAYLIDRACHVGATRRVAPTIIICIVIVVYAALTYQRNKIWHNGITLWSDVIAKSPNKSRPYHNRGFHYLERREYDKALADFNKAITLEPRYLQAYNNRATAYRGLGQPLLALKDYSKTIELSAGNAAGAYHNRGQLLADLGSPAMAMADFGRSLAANPQYFLATYNRGRLHAQLKDNDKALADFARTIEIAPNFGYTYAERGRLYLLLGRNDEALDDLGQCLKIVQNNLNCLNNRAIIYSRQKNYQLAIADMNRLIKLDTQNGAALFNRSLIFFAKKNFKQSLDDALEAQQRGFSVDKDYLEQLKTLVHEADGLLKGEGSAPLTK